MRDLEHYVERHEKTVHRQRSKAGRAPQCEVIIAGLKGPHQCDHLGWYLHDGHHVCSTHKFRTPDRYMVFTTSEAMDIARDRRAEKRLEMTIAANRLTEATP